MIWWIVVLTVGACMTAVLRQRQATSTINLPSVTPASPPFFLKSCSWLFHIASLLLVALAFVQCTLGSGPLERYIQPKIAELPPSPASSRFLLFVVDRSGSMAEPMPGNPSVSKMATVQDGLKTCLATIDDNGGANDLIGLITLARVANIKVPLTRDRTFFIHEINKLVPETIENLNGTAIGYAIFKSVTLLTACHFLAAEEKNPQKTASTIILITDGLEEPNPADRTDRFRSMRSFTALTIAKENHIRVQYVNVDKNSYQQLSADERDRLQKAVEATGGKYYEVTTNATLARTLDTIAQSEEVQKVTSEPIRSQELGFWLLLSALFFVSLSRLLETAFMRVCR